MNRDLAEVRRFWPKAGSWYLFGEVYIAKPVAQHKISISQHSNGSWYVTRYQSRPLRCQFFDGDTIAEAMAAAGFAKRPKGGHAKRRAMLAMSARLHPMLPGKTRVPLASRQRPRKGVRLGKRGRRLALAASMGEALELVRQKRLDRGEVGE